MTTINRSSNDCTYPTLNLTRYLRSQEDRERDQGESIDVLLQLAAEIVSLLRTPPHWMVLTNEELNLDHDLLTALFEEFAELKGNQEDQSSTISRTRVRVASHLDDSNSNVTRYSRTSNALPLHTDCSNKTNPENLVAFAMEQPDLDGGGETLMLAAKDLVEELPEELEATLRKPIFPFSRDQDFAIIDGKSKTPFIRYYRNQIENSLRQRNSVANDWVPALDHLDRLLDQSMKTVKFNLKAGEIVLMDNRRVLHGRTAMSQNSCRLMHRYRFSLCLLDD